MTERANEKIKIILEKILSGYSLSGLPHRSIEYPVNQLLSGVDITTAELELILDRLERGSVLENVEDLDQELELPEEQTYKIYFSDDFTKIAETYLQSLGVSKDETNEKSETGLILYLDSDGNLWHGSKDKFCYAIDAKSNRFQILKYLVENKGYQSPSDMIRSLETKTTKTLRSEIHKMRDNVTKFLGIDGKDLIDSKEDSGYRINPKYKIFPVKE